MKILTAIVSAIIVFIILHDAFEAIILPRRVSRRFRFTRRFYRLIWLPWRAASRRMRSSKRREVFLGYFGPLSLILLAETFRTPPVLPQPDRRPPEILKQLRSPLADSGVRLREGVDARRKLAELRRLYEPFVNALAKHLPIPIPPWVTTADRLDSWQISAWDRISMSRTSALFSRSQDDGHP